MDFVPEAIAPGAALALGSDTAFLLALLIALQNVPEAFNACREVRAGGRGFRSIAPWCCSCCWVCWVRWPQRPA